MSYLVQTMARIHLALVRDRSGATAIEYGLLAAGISVAIIATVFVLGTEINTLFVEVKDCLTGGQCGGTP